jgi:hypothetical protein
LIGIERGRASRRWRVSIQDKNSVREVLAHGEIPGSVTNRPQIPVEPFKRLANCGGTGKHAVPTLIDHVFFIAGCCAEKLEQRELRRLHWESAIVSSVQHEHRNGHMRHEVERVTLREIVDCELKTSGV